MQYFSFERRQVQSDAAMRNKIIKNGYPLLYYISFFDVRYNEEIFFLFTDTFERQSCGYWTRYSLEDSNVLFFGNATCSNITI